MENEAPKAEIFILKCGRCTKDIHTTTKPNPKINGFLCNSCHMGWKEREAKLLGHTYADEMRTHFIKYINGLAHLRNI